VLTDGVKPNVFLSGRNVPNVHVMPYSDSSTYHILWSDVVLVEAGAIGQTLAPIAEDAKAPARKAKAAAPAKAAAKKTTAKAAKKAPAKKAAAKKAKAPARKTTAKKSAAKHGPAKGSGKSTKKKGK
jgi:hypothetical protein